MDKKTPKIRIKEMKKQHRKSRIKSNKYSEWLSASFPMLELYSGRYELGERFRRII